MVLGLGGATGGACTGTGDGAGVARRTFVLTGSTGVGGGDGCGGSTASSMIFVRFRGALSTDPFGRPLVRFGSTSGGGLSGSCGFSSVVAEFSSSVAIYTVQIKQITGSS